MRTMYKGDITLLTVIMLSAIMLIILGALSQKSSIESVISRENLYSQQALQAANTGLDAWQYQFVQGEVKDLDNPLSLTRDWPTIASSPTGTQEWISLPGTTGGTIEYQVKYIPPSGGSPAKIISTGRFRRGTLLAPTLLIERTLEQEFN